VSRTLNLLLIVVILCLGCGATFRNNAEITGYDLTRPDDRIFLPDTLREISGLCWLENQQFACIQDENGILFYYDLSSQQLNKQKFFAPDGDYEGITRVGNTLYILRSDGALFEIADHRAENLKVQMYETGVVANNNEGLCYDEENNRLLIACKGKIGKGKELKDKRQIYAFDLRTKKLDPQPVYDFDMNAIRELAKKLNLDLPEKKHHKKNEEPTLNIKFATSAIAIHPVTKKLFLLSAQDKMFFIFDQQGNAEHIEVLDPTIFNKAEGITFLSNADMLITNEAQDKKPSLLRFMYRH
jgi:uncharacterized protein YjiK